MHRPFAFALLPALLAAVASGQDGSGQATQEETLELPAITVTTRKLEELLQEVPESVSVVGREDLEASGAESIKDAGLRVPNLHFTEFSARRLSFPRIRGVGSGQGEPSVVTTLDGVPQLNVSSTNLSLLDVERIEFLRGPQGTLYGRNALGGVLNVITRDPTWYPEGELRLTAGSKHQQDAALSFSDAASESLAWRIALSRESRDGYTKNSFTGHDVDDRLSHFGRARLLWVPSDRSEVRLTLYGERSRDGGFVLSDLYGLRQDPHRINQDFEGEVERDVLAPSVTWNWFGDAVDFVSITSFQDWEIDETSDFDFLPIDGVRRHTMEDQQSLMQELRLASAADAPLAVGDALTLAWVFGVFAFRAEGDESAANEFRPGGAGVLFPFSQVGTSTATGDFQDQALAFYTQGSLRAGPVELTGGVRFDREERDARLRSAFSVAGFPVFTSPVLRTSRNVDQWVPHVSLAWHATAQEMLYATWSRGFKAGGFNLTAPAGRQDYGPETSTTYETGWKSTWWDGRLTVNAAAFLIDWQDMQLSLFDATAGGFVDNAGDATSRGVELEVAVRPAACLTLYTSGGLLDTEFDRYTDPYGQDTSGNDLPYAPRSTFAVGGTWEGQIDRYTLYAGAEYQSVGEFYYDAGNRASENYDLARLRVGYRGDDWSLELWVHNLFDEEYVPVAFQANPADPTMFVGESGNPRVAGITATVRF